MGALRQPGGGGGQRSGASPMSPVEGPSREARSAKVEAWRRGGGVCRASRTCLAGTLLPLLLVLFLWQGVAVNGTDDTVEVEFPMDRTPLPIVVVGGGLAGLSAAAEIVAEGESVVIIEKTDRLGGNSAKASSGMSAAGSDPQLAQGIQDGPDLFLEDTLRSGKGLSSEELVEVVAKESAGAIRFLQGLGLNLSSIQQLGGHSKPRTHRAAPDGKPMNIGFRIMSALIAHLQDLQKKEPARVRILLRSKALELLTEPLTPFGASGTQGKAGEEILKVVGVRVMTSFPNPEEGETYENILGSSVILATGGYSADTQGLIAQHAPCLRQLPTTNGPFAQGDGVRLGSAVGAALVHMDQIQVHPTGLVDPSNASSGTKILGPEVLRGSGGILLNQQGKRFVNELDTRDKVVDAMLQSCSPLDAPAGAGPPCSAGVSASQCCPVPSVVAHLVLTQEALKAFGEAPAGFYLAKGLMKKFNSLEDLCSGLNLPLKEVAATIEAYDAAAGAAAGGNGTPDAFGKTVFPSRFTAHVGTKGGAQGAGEPLYSAIVTPVLHYCMGGLAFDERGHVLKAPLAQGEGEAQRIIPGLLAAGEVTGGLHGANRLAGNSLLECVVFGRRAAGTALMDAAEERDLLSAQEGMNVVFAPQVQEELMTGDEWADFVASRKTRHGKGAGAKAHEEL